MNNTWRTLSIASFLVLAGLSVYLAATRLTFSFDFEDFFPTGDPDLEFFYEFRDKFEPDDNFLLLGIRREAGVFNQEFLQRVDSLGRALQRLEFEIDTAQTPQTTNDPYLLARATPSGDSVYSLRPITAQQSLLNFQYPYKTPFGFTVFPAIHVEDTSRYAADKARILEDERLVNSLISEDAKTLVISMKTINDIRQPAAEKLIEEVHALVKPFNFEEYHLLGRANFQKELVEIQIFEFILSALVAGVLVLLVMYLIFRRFWGVLVSIVSIVLGLLLFLGALGGWGRELDAMAALYPVIMIIVGTSDVIHIMSKYIDELQKGLPRREAIRITMREIGMSILLTSTTTAIGFASLLTSRIPPIRNFGINAALGVMIAYVTILLFTTAALSFFKTEQIIKLGRSNRFWTDFMEWFYRVTRDYPKRILWAAAGVLLICFWGISKVSTNNRIEEIMPIGKKVTQDFQFFEREFSGFRPYEVAAMVQAPYTTDSFAVAEAVNKVEKHLQSYAAIQSVNSYSIMYKSLHRAYNGNQVEAYQMPEDAYTFYKYQKLLGKFGGAAADNLNILVSEDKKNARIAARILDVGADSVKAISRSVEDWIAANTDSSLVQFRLTGTGVIVDKNSEYVRRSLLEGLGFAILVVSLIMALLYKNIKLVLISLIPNVLPLLLAGALLGFASIEMEAGVAIVFAVVFGIAVDDTIHLLSRFRLLRRRGHTVDESLRLTLLETGKAICLTTLILFFGFLILLFSSNPSSFTVGLLISMTLFSALFGDLFLIPVLLRKFIKDKE